MKQHALLLVALALAASGMPAPGRAQSLCNAFDPSQRVVGYTPGPMGMPIAMCVPNETSQPEPSETSRASDPMQDRMDAVNAQANAVGSVIKQQREVLNNPEFQRLRAGYWDFPAPADGAQASIGCSATFKSSTGMLAVMAPTKSGQPVMTMFTGLDVPKPERPTPVEIVFHQSGGETMKMPAMNFAMSKDAPGTIAIGVRDLPSLLSGIKDAEELAIDLDGKRIYALAYHDGNAMKAHMKNCEAARKQ